MKEQGSSFRLELRFSRGSGSSWSVSVGPAFLGSLLFITAANIFAMGLYLGWVGPQGQGPAPDSETAAYIRHAGPPPVIPESHGTGGLGAPGHLPSEQEELITPLNVRDPAALVMPPAGMLEEKIRCPETSNRSKRFEVPKDDKFWHF